MVIVAAALWAHDRDVIITRYQRFVVSVVAGRRPLHAFANRIIAIRLGNRRGRIIRGVARCKCYRVVEEIIGCTVVRRA